MQDQKEKHVPNGDWLSRYMNGDETIHQIATTDGVSPSTVNQWLLRQPGYKARRGGWKRRQQPEEFWEPDDLDDFIERYQAGATPEQLAATYHVQCFGPPNVTDVRRVLRRNGIPLRNGAEARAVLGAYADKVGRHETELAGFLARCGFAPVQQKIVAGYNVDIACGNLAIEVQANTSIDPARTRKITGAGHSVLFVMFSNMHPFTDASMLAIAEQVQELRSGSADGLPVVRAMWADGQERTIPHLY